MLLNEQRKINNNNRKVLIISIRKESIYYVRVHFTQLNLIIKIIERRKRIKMKILDYTIKLSSVYWTILIMLIDLILKMNG